MVVYTKIINRNCPLQHSRNLFYNPQLLIHHLRVIPHKHLSRLDLIINTLPTTRTRKNISNIDGIQSCVTPLKQNYSVQATSAPNHLTPLNATLTIPYIKLHTTTKSPPVGKEYLCFQVNGKYSLAARCVKSRIMAKVIDSILSIDTFEQERVVLKGMLQSPHLKYHMKTVGIDQSMSNRASFE